MSTTLKKIMYEDIPYFNTVNNFRGFLLGFLDDVDPCITIMAHKSTARYLRRKYPERNIIIANDKAIKISGHRSSMTKIFISNDFKTLREAEAYLNVSVCKLVSINKLQ